MTLDEVIKQHTLKVLCELDGNRTRTAKSLGISIRTLRNYINEWKLQGVDFEFKEPVNEEDFNCMRNVTTEERDKWYSSDFCSAGKSKERKDKGITC